MKIDKKLRLLLEVRKSFIADGIKYPTHPIGGLCWFFNNIAPGYDVNFTHFRTQEFVELFNRKYAVKYCNAGYDHGAFWWDYSTVQYDFTNRLAFLDWMIARYQKYYYWYKFKGLFDFLCKR